MPQKVSGQGVLATASEWLHECLQLFLTMEVEGRMRVNPGPMCRVHPAMGHLLFWFCFL